MTWLFEMFGDWVSDFYMRLIQDFADSVIDFVLKLVDGFWQNNLLYAFLDFSVAINLIVLVVSILILCYDLAEENKPIIWKQILLNLFKGGLFTLFSRHIGILCLTLSNLIVQYLEIDVEPSVLWSVVTALPSTSLAMTLIWVLILIVSFVAFGVVCVIRNASMFVLIMSSALYIPDVVRGDTAKMGDWIRQVIAVSLTFVFQYILFCVGIGGCIQYNPVTALTGFAGIFVVPKVLQKFGYSSGVTGIFSSAGNMAMQARMFIK